MKRFLLIAAAVLSAAAFAATHGFKSLNQTEVHHD